MIERVLAVGDVHGCYSLLKKLIEDEIRFDPEKDRLVFIGDYMDRGPNSIEVVEYVFDELMGKYPDSIIALRGNHEQMFLGLPETHDLWLKNGGHATISNAVRCRGAIEPYYSSLKRIFSEKTRFFYEEEGIIFVHAGLNDGGLAATSQFEMVNLRNFKTYRGPQLIVGHTPHSSAMKYPNAIVIDSGAFLTGKLSAYDVKNAVLYTTNGIEPLKSSI